MQQPDPFPDLPAPPLALPSCGVGWRRPRRAQGGGLARRRPYRAALICRLWRCPAPRGIDARLRQDLAGLLRAVAGTVARRIDRRPDGKALDRGRRIVRAGPWWHARAACGHTPAAARDGAGR